MTLAIAFTSVLGLLALFQLALAFGVPWGSFAWGGQHEGVLPVGYRIGSGVSILIYGFIALIALDRSGVVDVLPDAFTNPAMWVVFGFFVLSILMNAASRSKKERYTMTPVVVALAAMAFFIAV
jgi:hypothetical protein